MATALTMTKQKKPPKWRHELKYNINCVDGIELSGRLKNIFKHDENANSRGIYRVSSLYFDTPYDKALRQKNDGVNQREKFRIRYYNDDTSFIRLEKKIKRSGMCAKYSARLSCEEVQMIIDGDIDFLLKSDNPLLVEVYSKLRGQLLQPKTVVSYDREAFKYEPGNVRITLDLNLRTGLNCKDFLNPKAWHADVSDNLAVLEVKYDNFLPEIVNMAVQISGRPLTAYSKYVVCRKYD